MIELTKAEILQRARYYLRGSTNNDLEEYPYIDLVTEELDEYTFYGYKVSDYYVVHYSDGKTIGPSRCLGVSKKDGFVCYLGEYGE